MDYLDQLESESVYILREAYRTIHPLGMLWSLGKDSNVMLWLARKAFLGRVPFPVVHVDTGKKFPEMYAFRDQYEEDWRLNLICGDCPPIEVIDASLPPAARSAARKTEGLKALMAKEKFAGVFAGIRRDEQAVRANERVFSPWGLDAEWEQHDQPAEFWGQYTTQMPLGSHIRIHPLLQWREIDIWRYTKRENIPVIDLYFSRKGYRYRSLGDQDITDPVKRSAATIDEVITELETTKIAERAGRAMDHEVKGIVERLPVVVVGHVDHGKSTLLGRLLFETDSLPEGKLESLREMINRRSTEFEWSFVLDAFKAERDQAITIDTTQIDLRTVSRDYLLIDAPGHEEFLKNMITGAANATAALLVIDVAEGVRDQTQRHAYLLKLLGVREVAVIVNKMDLVKHVREAFVAVSNEIRSYLKELGVPCQDVIPVTARHGDNLVSLSEKMPWYQGSTVIDALGAFSSSSPLIDKPLRLPVQDIYHFDARRIVVGRIESGRIKVGDEIEFAPNGKVAVVTGLERWNATPKVSAGAGESVALTLDRDLFIERGQIIHSDNSLHVTHDLRVRLIWFSRTALELSGKLQV